MGIPRARIRKIRFVTRRVHDKDDSKSPRLSKEMKMYAELKRKVCSRCNEEKSFDEFFADNSRKDGKNGYCKNCKKLSQRENVEKNRERYQEYEKRRQYKRHYGITFEQYNELFDLQQGCCACCGKHQKDCKRSLAVDHDHETMEIRALLCDNCNPGIGYFKHSTDKLRQAIAYLDKFKK